MYTILVYTVLWTYGNGSLYMCSKCIPKCLKLEIL